jgi:DNA-binding transcriptional LysR family regulator
MELRQLRSFLVLCEELHFGRAAQLLNISQPPLSRQIRQLEEELGVQLFRRTKRMVELTDAGRTFAGEARQIVAQVAHAAGLAEQVKRGAVGRLTVGYTLPKAHIIVSTLKAFAQRCPDAHVLLEYLPGEGRGERMEFIRDGRIDVGFVGLHADKKDLVVEPILREGFVIAMAKNHPLSARSQVPVHALAHERCILYPRHWNPSEHDLLTGLCQKAGFAMNIAYEVENIHMRFELVGKGFGVSIARASSQELHRNDVVFRSLKNSPKVGMGIAYSPENRSQILASFIETVRKKPWKREYDLRALAATNSRLTLVS